MRVQVGGITLSCAHFIEIEGKFERLHGHNLVASAEVEGPGSEGIVTDFHDLERILTEITSKLDHKLLIPKENPHLKISEAEDYYEIRAGRKRYRMPASDVIQLPIRNSTVEEIGRYLFDQVSDRLSESVKLRFLSVEEMEGKRAIIDDSS